MSLEFFEPWKYTKKKDYEFCESLNFIAVYCGIIYILNIIIDINCFGKPGITDSSHISCGIYLRQPKHH